MVMRGGTHFAERINMDVKRRKCMALMKSLFGNRKTDKNEQELENPAHVRFYMSFRFNKTKPEDFGLISTEQENIFIDPKDDSK
jgi:hypothetical protein